MRVAIRALVIALVIVREGKGSGPFVQQALTKVFGSWTPYANFRVIQLLNQLCNESQLDDEVRKDACYGCFFRASSQPTGYPMLLNMASCSDTYLNNTNYGHCQTYLRNATNSASTRTSPGIVYCSFIECIRQVNKDMLIRQCVVEAIGISGASFNCSDSGQLARLFVNATACVLAKTRCAFPNPVTGAVQEADSLYGKLQNNFAANALQVNTDYDLSIIRLPFVHPVKSDDCGQFRNVEQAGWPSVDC